MKSEFTKDVLVVGAGISGATVARVLAERGFKVTVLEKRATVAGNLYDYVDENGVMVQEYGPHIFHTNFPEVYEFLSKFTEWYKYEHRVLGNIDGKLVPVPFNLTSLAELYPVAEAEKIKSILISEIGMDKKVPILKLREHKDALIREFAEFVYQKVFYFYTKKQWGFKPEELGEAVMNRVPVYVSYEDRYFTDEYQFQPTEGFAAMVQRMLDHENIEVKLNTDALEAVEIRDGEVYYHSENYSGRLIFTGRIDDLFREKFGRLKYRSLDFVFETHDTPSYQPAAVVNYNTSEDYTRISEFSKFCCQPKAKTVIIKEYSKSCGEGDIPYYPIPTPDCQAEYERYLKLSEGVHGLYLLGRLANYKYANIDVAVKSAIELAERILEEEKAPALI